MIARNLVVAHQKPDNDQDARNAETPRDQILHVCARSLVARAPSPNDKNGSVSPVSGSTRVAFRLGVQFQALGVPSVGKSAAFAAWKAGTALGGSNDHGTSIAV